jgi:hypothetical protein
MNFDIIIPTEDFDAALKQINKWNKGKKPFDLTLEFDGVSLQMATALVTLSIPANGQADVRIGMPGKVMVRMQSAFPGKQIHLRLEGAILKIETLNMPCTILP